MRELKSLRDQYAHLDIIERPETTDKVAFLRYQAREPVIEQLSLPAIPQIRAEVSATVTFHRLIAYADTLEGLKESLRVYYATMIAEAA